MTPASRSVALRSAVRLSAASVAWNSIAGITAALAGIVAGSLALLGFGLDSVVDGAASCVLLWRFSAEGADVRRGAVLEHRATRVVAMALTVIGLYVGVRAIVSLAAGTAPGSTVLGSAIAAASVLLLPPLALAKRRVAAQLDSRALRGDSVLTAMGAVLAAAALVGLGARRWLDWWWADSLVAIIIALILVREGAAMFRSR